jgi:PhnB protein
VEVLGIPYCSVAPDSADVAAFLDALGLPRKALDMPGSDPTSFAGAIFPAGSSWIELWPAGSGMPEGTMLQVVVDDADAFAEHARAHGLQPKGPVDSHGERIYFARGPGGLQVSFQSSSTAAWKPAGYPSLSPYLITDRAHDVVSFLTAAVGATPLRRHDRPDGTIMHAELRIDDSVVMLGQAGGDWPAVPMHMHLYVPDVDAVYAAAIAAGGRSVQAPEQKGDADRRCGVVDPGGNTWWFATQQPG